MQQVWRHDAEHGDRAPLADAQDGEALLDAGQLDVVSADPFPRVPNEPPLLDPRGLAAAGIPVRAVRFVAQATGNAYDVPSLRHAVPGVPTFPVGALTPAPSATFPRGLFCWSQSHELTCTLMSPMPEA